LPEGSVRSISGDSGSAPAGPGARVFTRRRLRSPVPKSVSRTELSEMVAMGSLFPQISIVCLGLIMDGARAEWGCYKVMCPKSIRTKQHRSRQACAGAGCT
jgi:hypothetical protein